MTDPHYPFQEDWEARQAEPLPETTKPKAALPIGFHEIPPLDTKEKPTDSIRKSVGDTNTSHNTKGLF